jgi:glutathione S-transferase
VGRLRRPSAEEFARLKLRRLADWIGGKEWLEDRFTIGDLMMVSVLRILRNTELVEQHASLVDYQARAEERPAFQRALEAQLSDFKKES